MPEYSTPKLTPAETTKLTGMNSGSSGYFEVKDVLDIIRNTYGQNNGVATLGSDGKLPSSQLPDLADDVIVVASYATLPAIGTAGKIYITADNNKMFRWDSDLETPDYVELSVDLSAYATKAELAEEESAREAADSNLKAAIDAIDHRLDNLEQAKGKYEVKNYKDGSVTPSGKGAWAIVEGLRGVSRVENQLVQNWNFEGTGTPWSGLSSVSNNVGIKSSYIPQYSNNGIHQNNVFNANHLHLIKCTVKNTSASERTFFVGQAYSNNSYVLATIGAGETKDVIGLITPTTVSDNGYGFGVGLNSGLSAEASFEVSKVICRDLTLYFGGTIPSDADTIAEIQTNYPHLLTPSDYGTRIVDSSYSGVRAWARNLLDKTQIKDTTYGTPTISGERISVTGTYYCSFNINLEAGQYYLKFTVVSYTGSRGVRLQYEDGTLVDTLTSSGLVTLTKKATTVLLYCGSGSSATSVYEDICINKSDSLDGTFTPYHAPSTLSLTFTGKSAGSVSEMYYPETGEQTKPIGSIADLSTLNWGKNTSGQFYAILPVAGVSDTTGSNVLCTKYLGGNAYGKADKTICINGSTNSILWICDLAIDSAADLKTALTNVPLYYELATTNPSTFVTPIIDNTLLTEAGGRMATVQTGTVVDGSFDMGFITL